MVSLHLQGQKKKLLERQDIQYIKQQLLKDSFKVKRYGKGLLIQIKVEEMYKILIEIAFTKDKYSPFEKIEPHKTFNIQWRTIYSRDLVEFTKGEDIRNVP